MSLKVNQKIDSTICAWIIAADTTFLRVAKPKWSSGRESTTAGTGPWPGPPEGSPYEDKAMIVYYIMLKILIQTLFWFSLKWFKNRC